MDIPYLEGSLIFLTMVFFWEMYLQVRQHRKFYESEIPAPIRGIITQEVFDKARAYGKDKSWFTLASQTFNHVETLLVLYLGGLPFLWKIAGNILEHFGLIHTEYEVTQSVLFLYLSTVYQVIMQLPWNLYYTFVLEQRHGFNKQTPKFYFMDQFKSFILTLVLTAVLVPPLIYIIKWGGEHFYLYAWLFVFIISLLALTVYQDYIAPIFDKFEPMKDGPLKKKIEDLAASIGFPLGQLLVVHASMRSSHSNAYFYGFFTTKKIVLFDTLLSDEYHAKDKKEDGEGKVEDTNEEKPKADASKACTDVEVLAILSHELGHWKLNHTLKNFVIGQANAFTSFMLFGLLMHNDRVYEAFGFDTMPVIIGLLLILQYIFSPINVFLNYCITKLTRYHEYQADDYAVSLGYGAQLQDALVKLQIGNLGNMNPDPWYSEYHYSHPPLVERLQAMRDTMAKGKKAQ
eukprot:comp22093_c0_seq1/m.32226 comp22093_c0_seq1/g.32226  ORF comp22093_c0_seq1/g.32226 comp22093_c0_seq1/m.32226 type:complete len:459 (-) comp22093_c0_seq1:782-2158(-)